MATNDENPLNRKTHDGHTLGDFVVGDSGISRIIDVDGYGGYTAERIMPKEVFVEAYKKYIIDDSKKCVMKESGEHGYCDTCKHKGGYPKYETCQGCLNFDKYEKGDTD